MTFIVGCYEVNQWKGSKTLKEIKTVIWKMQTDYYSLRNQVSSFALERIQDYERQINKGIREKEYYKLNFILPLVYEEGGGCWKKEIEKVIEKKWNKVKDEPTFDTSPLYRTAMRGDPKMFIYLLNKGLKVRKATSPQTSKFQLFIHAGYLEGVSILVQNYNEDVNRYFFDGYTPLTLASQI